MAAVGEDSAARRSVVPPAAGRSLWLSAMWTGAGAAFVCAVLAIVAVAVCWLPAAGASGHAGSAIRAGVLTFLAALHGGIRVDGVSASFVPLGLTLVVGAVAWRAGSGLADAAHDLDERDPGRLLGAALLQAAAFGAACGVAAHLSRLGTSSVSTSSAVLAGAVLWLVTGSVSFARGCALAEAIRSLPAAVRSAVRIGAGAAAVELAGGALLVAGSLVIHHGTVTALSREVGGGWSGLPVLLLGILTAPNAAVAGVGYLSGPGVTIGSGTTAAIGVAPHGTLPAFPVLGALPTGPNPGIAVWVLIVATPLAAGACAAVLARWSGTGLARWGNLLLGAPLAGFSALVAAWLAGGGIGGGRLATVGVSPWQLGLAVAGMTAAAGLAALGLAEAATALRGRRTSAATPYAPLRPLAHAVRVFDAARDGGKREASAEDAQSRDELAG